MLLGVSYANDETNGQWVVKEDLPESLPSPIVQWATRKLHDEVTFGIDEAITLTKIMEAAYKSHYSGKKEKVQ